MIRNEAEYQEASARLAEERSRLAEHRARLKEAGLSDEEIKRVIDPMESFHLQLKEEVESYERLKRGEFEELENFRGFGHLLISLRIAQGISQRELARRLTCMSHKFLEMNEMNILESPLNAPSKSWTHSMYDFTPRWKLNPHGKWFSLSLQSRL